VYACGSFYFDAVSGPQPGSFLLFAQKETNQRKGPPVTQISANNALIPLCFSPALAHNQTRTKNVLKQGCA